MMSLPKQVEEAADLAEKFMEDLEKGSTDESTEETAPDEKEEEATNEGETSEPETQKDEAVDDKEVDGDDEQEETYQKRYDTLQGKYNAEVPRLHNEIKELKENIFGKIDEITKAQNDNAEPEETKSLTDSLARLKEEAGDDFADILLDVIRDQVAPVVESNVKAVDERIDNVEETQVTAAQDEFSNYLDEHIDSGKNELSWKDAWNGDDPKFLEFLGKPEPSGLYTYGQLVEMYNNEWNAEGLSKIFNIYYGSNTAPVKPVSPKKETKKETRSPEEEAMIAPTRDTQHETPNDGEKRIWTVKDIETFKRDDRAKKFTPEESQDMWDDLLSALAENRIR